MRETREGSIHETIAAFAKEVSNVNDHLAIHDPTLTSRFDNFLRTGISGSIDRGDSAAYHDLHDLVDRARRTPMPDHKEMLDAMKAELKSSREELKDVLASRNFAEISDMLKQFSKYESKTSRRAARNRLKRAMGVIGDAMPRVNNVSEQWKAAEEASARIGIGETQTSMIRVEKNLAKMQILEKALDEIEQSGSVARGITFLIDIVNDPPSVRRYGLDEQRYRARELDDMIRHALDHSIFDPANNDLLRGIIDARLNQLARRMEDAGDIIFNTDPDGSVSVIKFPGAKLSKGDVEEINRLHQLLFAEAHLYMHVMDANGVAEMNGTLNQANRYLDAFAKAFGFKSSNVANSNKFSRETGRALLNELNDSNMLVSYFVMQRLEKQVRKDIISYFDKDEQAAHELIVRLLGSRHDLSSLLRAETRRIVAVPAHTIGTT
ncbi:MAG: hypothetical protein KGH72_01205 [Candidatus Micrarchaeota archaeon]|nr:hypothetical protein [Candidatus Micrarchaeota archaeon]